MMGRLVAVGMGAAFLAGRAAGADGGAELPRRIDPLREPTPDGTTLLLWRMEEGAPRDSSEGGNHGMGTGGLEPCEGRFGKGLRFSGGRSAVILPSLSEPPGARGAVAGIAWVLDFWCRFEAAPPFRGCLLHAPGLGNLRLDVDENLRLRLSTDASEATVAAGPLDTARWRHLALMHVTYDQPNGIYGDGSGIELLIDGETAGVLWETRPSSTGGSEIGSFSLCLGNCASLDGGIVAAVDEVRLSRGVAGVYPLRPESPHRPAETLERRSARHFRHPEREVFYQSFEDPVCTGRVEWVREGMALRSTGARQERPVGPPRLETPAESELSPMDPDVLAQAALCRGLVGTGLHVRGGVARIAVPERNGLTEEGTLELWFQPLDWDNLGATARGVAYEHRQAHLVTLWGRSSATGPEEPLVRVTVDRASGTRPVRPEYRRYMKPKLPVTPRRWCHLVVTWSRRFEFLRTCTADGHPLPATFAPEADWDGKKISAISLGNKFETAFDEVRIYGYAFEGQERSNARAHALGELLRPLEEEEEPQSLLSLGDFPVEAGTSLLPKISGSWLKGWVTGIRERGPARAFFGYRPDVGEIIVALAPFPHAGVREAEVSLGGTRDRMLSARIPRFQGGLGGVVLSVGELPPGDYRLEGFWRREDGSRSEPFESWFRWRPHPSLESHELGCLKDPPPPFVPVTRDGARLSVIGRTYRVGTDGLIEALEILGEEVLAAPMQYEIQVQGRTEPMRGRQVEIGDSTPVGVEWAAVAEGRGVVVRSRSRLEYDGYISCLMEVTPINAGAPVDRLSLVVPLKAEHAQFFHVLGFNAGSQNPYGTGELRPGEGVVWDSVTDCADRKLGQVPCQMWLGGPVRGLVWYADSDRDWVSSEEGRPAMTVTRQGKVVVLHVHVINGSCSLTRPLHIGFGLLGTPPKPLPLNYRLWNRGRIETVGKIGGRLTSCDAFAPWVLPCRDSTFAYWPPEDDWDLVRLATARQAEGHGSKYPPGQALIMYHDKNKCPIHPAAVAGYAWSWGAGRYPRSRIRHLVWYMDRMIDCGFDGVYIDGVGPIGDWNLEPVGTSWLRQGPEGTQSKQVGSEAGEYREYLKRLYGLLAARGKPPFITTHMSTTLGWPYHTFVSVIFDHENVERFRKPHGTFIDAWPLDYLMTLDIAERSGLVTVPMMKDQYLKGRTSLQTWIAQRSYQAIWMLFDLNVPLDGTVMEPWYGTDVEVLPFWRNASFVTVRPLPGPPVVERDLPMPDWWKSEHVRKGLAERPFRATLYRRANRLLVVVVNFLRRSAQCGVEIHWDALGVEGEAIKSLRVSDPDQDRPPEAVNLLALHLDDLGVKKEEGGMLDREGAVTMSASGVDLDGPARQSISFADSERFRRMETAEREIRLWVGPHNFRTIELQW